MILITFLGLTACGGGSQHSSTTRASAPDSEQTRLLSQLRSELEAPSSSVATVRDLDECTLTPAQLAAALDQEATGNQELSRRLGRGLALSCIKKPAIYSQWRKLWVAEISRSLNGRHLPAAFVRCVLGKAGQIGATQLVKLVQAGSAAETGYGEKLGRACRSSLNG